MVRQQRSPPRQTGDHVQLRHEVDALRRVQLAQLEQQRALEREREAQLLFARLQHQQHQPAAAPSPHPQPVQPRCVFDEVPFLHRYLQGEPHPPTSPLAASQRTQRALLIQASMNDAKDTLEHSRRQRRVMEERLTLIYSSPPPKMPLSTTSMAAERLKISRMVDRAIADLDAGWKPTTCLPSASWKQAPLAPPVTRPAVQARRPPTAPPPPAIRPAVKLSSPTKRQPKIPSGDSVGRMSKSAKMVAAAPAVPILARTSTLLPPSVQHQLEMDAKADRERQLLENRLEAVEAHVLSMKAESKDILSPNVDTGSDAALADMASAWLEQEVVSALFESSYLSTSKMIQESTDCLLESIILEQIDTAAMNAVLDSVSTLTDAEPYRPPVMESVPTPHSTPRSSPGLVPSPTMSAPTYFFAPTTVSTPQPSPPSTPRQRSPLRRPATPPHLVRHASVFTQPLPPTVTVATSPMAEMPRMQSSLLPSPPPSAATVAAPVFLQPAVLTPRRPSSAAAPEPETEEEALSEGELLLESDGEVYPERLYSRVPFTAALVGLAGVALSQCSSDSELEYTSVPLPQHRSHTPSISLGQLSLSVSLNSGLRGSSHVSAGEVFSPGQARRHFQPDLHRTLSGEQSTLSDFEAGEQFSTAALSSDGSNSATEE